MTLTEYETTLVVRPDIGGDSVEATLDRLREVVRQGGGKLLAINHWGKRKLAYEIEKHSRGVFVHGHYLGNNTLVKELERNLRISDNVLRFMTIKLSEFVAVDSRQEQAYVRPQYDAPEELEGQEALDAAEEGAEGEGEAKAEQSGDEAASDKEKAPQTQEGE